LELFDGYREFTNDETLPSTYSGASGLQIGAQMSTAEQKPAMWRSKSRPLEVYESDIRNAWRAQVPALPK
jgi:hypothetical protein